MMSELTSVFRSGAIMITRHGVVIVPSIAAGCDKRFASALPKRKSKGWLTGSA